MTAADRAWLNEAIASRDLNRVEPNMAAAGDRVNDARRHVRSARLLADDDPTLAMAASTTPSARPSPLTWPPSVFGRAAATARTGSSSTTPATSSAT